MDGAVTIFTDVMFQVDMHIFSREAKLQLLFETVFLRDLRGNREPTLNARLFSVDRNAVNFIVYLS